MEFPGFGGKGRSIDLLDEQLVILGDNKLGGKFEYKSIHQPRRGLLGMKFSKDVSPVGNSPLWLRIAKSYIFRANHLIAVNNRKGLREVKGVLRAYR